MFANLLKFVLEHEGGYVNHPNDPGGATNYGITQKTYDAYNEENGFPKQDVKDIKLGTVANIYYDKYWEPEWEKLGFPLAACMFDTSVNMGKKRAYTFLENCAGSYVTFLQLRLAKYKELIEKNPRLRVFEKGWNNRVRDLRNFIEMEKNST